MINIQRERKRKSEKLNKEESQSLQKMVNSFDTVVEAAEFIGIHRNVLDLVLVRKSGAPETIEKIRSKINAQGEVTPSTRQ